MKMHVGTSGYGYKEWKGVFYPEKISPKDMLRFYGERLNAVEINYTFYHMPTERVLAPWAEQVPEGFAFALKASQVITHLKQLRNVEEETDYFFRTVTVLAGKLGPVLFQFPKSFHARKNFSALEEFLPLIPDSVPCAFDFRSPTWLEAGMPELLRTRGFSLCIEDTDEHPADEIVSTASWGRSSSSFPRASTRERTSRRWRNSSRSFPKTFSAPSISAAPPGSRPACRSSSAGGVSAFA